MIAAESDFDVDMIVIWRRKKSNAVASAEQKHHMFTLHIYENKWSFDIYNDLWNMRFIYGTIFVMINNWIARCMIKK